MACKHPIELLLGTGDGIVCRGCGKTFATFAELEADRPTEEKTAEKPKKARSKKA